MGGFSYLNGSSFNNTLSDLNWAGMVDNGSSTLRILISIVYSAVCAVGLVGNSLVFFLMKAHQGRNKWSTINFFVINLAVTDLQFVFTLPFWAVDTALDFSWPFGNTMCKIVLSVTVMNMYASVFFLTAMSVTRYLSIANALKERTRFKTCSVKGICALLWIGATAAMVPTAVFSTVTEVAGETLCVWNFPGGHLSWLAIYHIQKIVIAFIIPLIIIATCYLRLLRLIHSHGMRNNQSKRDSKVTKSVTIVVLSFFLCWMPNHAITLWSVLIKLSIVHWDHAFDMVQSYIFPVTICLAHANSCLNPVLYCLMRREYRIMLKEWFWKISPPTMTKVCRKGPCSSKMKTEHDSIPLQGMETEQSILSNSHQ